MTSATPSLCARCWTGTATGVDVQARMLWLATYLGHAKPASSFWYLTGAPELLALGRRPPGDDDGGPGMTLLAPTLQAWFTERLMTQRQASPHTIAGYRDTMRLLLSFASTKLGKPPSKLEIDDLDAELITAVPHASRARTRQQRPNPERAAGGDPLALPIRRVPSPRTRRGDRTGARDPDQTVRPRAGQLPHQRRSPRAASTPRTRTRGPAGETTRCS